MSRVWLRLLPALGRLSGRAGRAALAAMATWTLVAQGTVHFSNFVPEAGIDAPVFDLDGVTRLAGTNWAAQLYAGPNAQALEPIGSPVAFETGLYAGYLAGSGAEGGPPRPVTIPFAPGGTAALRVRAWSVQDGRTFEEALAAKGPVGESDLLPWTGGGVPPTAPVRLEGLRSFLLQEPVKIRLPPQKTVVLAGADAVLSSYATGGSLSYQWFVGNARIIGATGSEFTLSGATWTMSGVYSVEVCNLHGCARSAPAEVTVREEGGTVNFNNHVPEAGIDAPVFDLDGMTRLEGPRYVAQLFTGVQAKGASLPFLTGDGAGYWSLSNTVIRTIPGVYSGEVAVRVGVFDREAGATLEEVVNAGGKAGFSQAVNVTLGGGPKPAGNLVGLKSFALQQPPYVVWSPTNVVTPLGEPAEFRVVAHGSPLAFQWWKDGLALMGATGATHRFLTVDPQQAGGYWVTVSNALNVRTSTVAYLTVLPSRTPGWLRLDNRVPEAGIDAPVFDLDGVTRLAGTDHAMQLYTGRSPEALGPIGPAVSFGTGTDAGYLDRSNDLDRAVPWVHAGGRVWAQVRTFHRRDGSSFEQVVAAGGVAGVSSVLAVVTGGEGDRTSGGAPLIGLRSFPVLRAPRVVVEMTNQTKEAGQSVEFKALITGTAPTYQWRFQDQGRHAEKDLSGATNATLRFDNLFCRMAGEYRLVVANALGRATSAPIVLTVNFQTQGTQTGGTLAFNNRVLPEGIDAPFTYRGVRVDGQGWLGQIHAGPTEGALAPVGVPVGFRTGTAAGYINGGEVHVPSVPPGGLAWVRVCAWRRTDGCSYEDAVAAGGAALRSSLISVILGGLGTPPSLPASLVGLQTSEAPYETWIGSVPVDQTVSPGADVTFSLYAEACANTWGHPCWYINPSWWSTDAPSRTGWTIRNEGRTLAITNVTSQHAGFYTAKLSVGWGVEYTARLRVLDRPLLSPSVLLLAEGGVRLRLEGPRFFEHVIEVSHDLRYWAELHRVLLTNDWVEIDDPLAGQGRSWFYRARVVP